MSEPTLRNYIDNYNDIERTYNGSKANKNIRFGNMLFSEFINKLSQVTIYRNNFVNHIKNIFEKITDKLFESNKQSFDYQINQIIFLFNSNENLIDINLIDINNVRMGGGTQYTQIFNYVHDEYYLERAVINNNIIHSMSFIDSYDSLKMYINEFLTRGYINEFLTMDTYILLLNQVRILFDGETDNNIFTILSHIFDIYYDKIISSTSNRVRFMSELFITLNDLSTIKSISIQQDTYNLSNMLFHFFLNKTRINDRLFHNRLNLTDITDLVVENTYMYHILENPDESQFQTQLNTNIKNYLTRRDPSRTITTKEELKTYLYN